MYQKIKSNKRFLSQILKITTLLPLEIKILKEIKINVLSRTYLKPPAGIEISLITISISVFSSKESQKISVGLSNLFIRN